MRVRVGSMVMRSQKHAPGIATRAELPGSTCTHATKGRPQPRHTDRGSKLLTRSQPSFQPIEPRTPCIMPHLVIVAHAGSWGSNLERLLETSSSCTLRITQEHRLVYLVRGNRIEFLMARYHY